MSSPDRLFAVLASSNTLCALRVALSPHVRTADICPLILLRQNMTERFRENALRRRHDPDSRLRAVRIFATPPAAAAGPRPRPECRTVAPGVGGAGRRCRGSGRLCRPAMARVRRGQGSPASCRAADPHSRWRRGSPTFDLGVGGVIDRVHCDCLVVR